MKVLGIDPGTATMGWGVVEGQGPRLQVVDYGVISTSKGLDMPLRLKDLYDGLMKLMEMHGPEAVAIEDLFFFKNAKTVIKVSQARGVAILAAVNNDVAVFDYTPLQVKQAITGYGRAEKKQMQKMVQLMLKLKEIPKPDDAADALAIAICHLNSYKLSH